MLNAEKILILHLFKYIFNLHSLILEANELNLATFFYFKITIIIFHAIRLKMGCWFTVEMFELQYKFTRQII